MAARKARSKAAPPLPFAHRLVLNQWMLGLFEVDEFDKLAKHLQDERFEGLDENNVHRFHHALCGQFFELKELPKERLLEYDLNIVAHTQRLNERRITRREEPIQWKYFQYLTLLFVEIYLDRYFTDPGALLSSINARIVAFNGGKPPGDQVRALDEGADAWSQLNKVAFWSATGSGKTLLMHANILQYRHYLARAGRTRELNRVLLLTPNEGLSRQHLEEFDKAGIQAELFQEGARGLFDDKAVEVIEITKLKEERGETTFDVEAFLGNNLVLVDEGHRGASGGGEGKWMQRRDALCSEGFSFEYSATFGQAVSKNADLADLYAKSILFDYSYRWFHRDGFGKEFQILNLDKATHQQHSELYLTACVLSFFQQLRLFQHGDAAFRAFHIERPLWIFVGGSVNAVRKENKEEVSDVVSVLLFLKRFVANRTETEERIRRVLLEGLVNSKGQNIFKDRFRYLASTALQPAEVFDEVLSLVFNAPAGGVLRVEHLTGSDGEIALQLGDNEAFGVINVGDAARLKKLCEENGLTATDREFRGSLFHELSRKESKIQLLIGSKKFTEGWSSWRVSTMGLMNVGSTEGSQIIQLFGRGVRLKGFGFSLKRSGRAALPMGVKPPKYIEVLETLGIFGVRADYMQQFTELLKLEDVPTSDEKIQIVLPIVPDLGSKKLRTVRLKKVIDGVRTEFGDAFRRLSRVPTVQKPNPDIDKNTQRLRKHPVVVDWYPRIQAVRSSGLAVLDEDKKTELKLDGKHLAFVDFDRVFADIGRLKAQKGWFNLNLSRDELRELLNDTTWYRLQIAESELALGPFARTRVWQEIVHALVRKYVERYYAFKKSEWEGPHLEYQELTEDDPNFLVREEPEEGGYRIELDESQTEIAERLLELKAAIQQGHLKKVEMAQLKLIWFDRHLYQPLIYLENSTIQVSPVALNDGERRFVLDLQRFHQAEASYFKGKELYLLRNQSRGRGVGFFEAENFHPDFILWLLVGSEQHVVFVDPKGLRNVPVRDPKVEFHQSVKAIERRLNDPNTHLHSFLVSPTPSSEVQMFWQMDKAAMQARNIVFQEDTDSYIRQLLDTVLGSESAYAGVRA